jgi:hypothetical protein
MKQLRKTVLWMLLLCTTLATISAQDTLFTMKVNGAGLCTPLGSVEFTQAIPQAGKTYELEYYKDLGEENPDIIRKEIGSYAQITNLDAGNYHFKIWVGDFCFQEFEADIDNVTYDDSALRSLI